MQKNFRLALLALLLIVVAGCSLFSRPQDVAVSLADLAISEVTLLNTTLNVKVRLDNESSNTLQVRGLLLRLYINGDYVGKGMARVSRDIPSFEAGEFQLPIRLGNLSVVRNVQDWVGESGFSYRLEGRVDQPFGSVPVSVSDNYHP